MVGHIVGSSEQNIFSSETCAKHHNSSSMHCQTVSARLINFFRFCVLGQNKGINGENLRRIEILLFKHHNRSISGSSGTPHGWFSDRDCYCFCMNKQSTVETNFYLEQSLHDFQYRNVSTIFMKALFYRGPILE